MPNLEVLDKYNCQFLGHGDDMIQVDGEIMYEDIQKAGRLKIYQRTDGISTTDIVGRMLRLSRSH